MHADDLEALVWRVVTDALSKPDMLLALAEEQAQASATASDINQDDLASLDHKIARLERAAGEQLAKALAAGADPKVAAIAAVSLKRRSRPRASAARPSPRGPPTSPSDDPGPTSSPASPTMLHGHSSRTGTSLRNNGSSKRCQLK